MKIDHQAWIQQPKLLAERCRGLALMWTPDVKWFNNDWLGPTPHCHEDATEIAFMGQGQLEIEVGGSKRVYHPGDFILMPPNKYHNYWFTGEDPVCLFVVVAPNPKYRRLRTTDITPNMHEGDAPYANVFTSDTLPSNEHFLTEKCTLQPGKCADLRAIEQQDRVIYVVAGTAQVRLHTLSGPLAANQFIHIPASTHHQICTIGYEPLIYISLTITDADTAHGTGLKEEA
jgi:mannose-6-phosphate isomerase-like protein (cupin superfamily)